MTNVREYEFFKQVSAVLGEAGAKHELERINQSKVYAGAKDLMAAFIWDYTPQGRHFWAAIDRGATPHGLEKPVEAPGIMPVYLWGCFYQVANVIGTDNALQELNRVRDVLIAGCDSKINLAGRLIKSFEWWLSPQGEDFWHAINEGNVPDQLQQPKQGTKRTLQVGDEIVLTERLGESHDNQPFKDFAGQRVVVIGLITDVEGLPVMVVQCQGGGAFIAVLAHDRLYTFADEEPEDLREKILEDWKSYKVDNRCDGLEDTTTVREVIDFVMSKTKQGTPSTN